MVWVSVRHEPVVWVSVRHDCLCLLGVGADRAGLPYARVSRALCCFHRWPSRRSWPRAPQQKRVSTITRSTCRCRACFRPVGLPTRPAACHPLSTCLAGHPPSTPLRLSAPPVPPPLPYLSQACITSLSLPATHDLTSDAAPHMHLQGGPLWTQEQWAFR